MKKLEIPEVETFIAAIQDEISRTHEGRYYHRLHVILHALKTGDGYEAARIYEHSTRNVYNWIHRLTSMKPGIRGKGSLNFGFTSSVTMDWPVPDRLSCNSSPDGSTRALIPHVDARAFSSNGTCISWEPGQSTKIENS